MQTRAQSSAFRKGTVAALERKKARVKSLIAIEHTPDVAGPSLLKGITHWLAASGAVNMATTSITLSEDVQALQTALERSELDRENTHKRLEEALGTIDELMRTAQTPSQERWITLKEAVLEIGVDYSTVWRAHKAKRLQTKVIGGGRKKDQLLCNPKTYIPTAYMLKKTQSQ